MEKYIVIILIAIVLYTVYKTCSITEGSFTEAFGDAVTVDGVDDNNAINTLAKIAKDLQEGGGLKVKGNLLVDNTIRVTGAKTTPAGSGDMMTHFNHADGNNYIRGNTWLAGNMNSSGWTTTTGLTSNGVWPIVVGPEKNKFVFHTPDDDRKGIWICPANNDDAKAWLWNTGLNLRRDGNHELGGRLKIGNRDILAELDDLKNYTNKLKTRINFEGDNTIMNFQGAEVRNINCNGNKSRQLHQGCNFWNAFG